MQVGGRTLSWQVKAAEAGSQRTRCMMQAATWGIAVQVYRLRAPAIYIYTELTEADSSKLPEKTLESLRQSRLSEIQPLSGDSCAWSLQIKTSEAWKRVLCDRLLGFEIPERGQVHGQHDDGPAAGL
jgi:hypothetical protein